MNEHRVLEKAMCAGYVDSDWTVNTPARRFLRARPRAAPRPNPPIAATFRYAIRALCGFRRGKMAFPTLG